MASLDILLPHYNDPEGLKLSLNSILQQDWNGEKRVVIVDDGSSQDVLRTLKATVEEGNHLDATGFPVAIDLILNESNRGRPYTRNVLLDAIESPYVAWLDAGDEWYADKISTQFGVLDSSEASLDKPLAWVTCNYDWCWIGGRKRQINQKTRQDQHKALLIGSSLRAYLWTLLGSANSFKSVGYFDERLPRMQDLDYFIRFVSHGGNLLNIKGDKTYCIYHKSDVGRKADEIRECNALIYDKHRVIFNRYGKSFCQMRLYNMDMLAARFAQNNDDRSKSRHYLWSAFKNRPWAFIKHVRSKGFVA